MARDRIGREADVQRLLDEGVTADLGPIALRNMTIATPPKSFYDKGADAEATALAGKRSIRFKAVLKKFADW